jgi:hypothetical protein
MNEGRKAYPYIHFAAVFICPVFEFKWKKYHGRVGGTLITMGIMKKQ